MEIDIVDPACDARCVDPHEERFYAELGAAIRNARKYSGFTQRDAAAAAGLSRTSLTNIEAGRQSVAAHVLVRLAEAMDVPAGDLLPEHTSRSPSSLVDQVPEHQRPFVMSVLEGDE